MKAAKRRLRHGHVFTRRQAVSARALRLGRKLYRAQRAEVAQAANVGHDILSELEAVIAKGQNDSVLRALASELPDDDETLNAGEIKRVRD